MTHSKILIHKLKSLKECVSTALLAPYPTSGISKMKKYSGKKYSGVPIEDLVEAGIGYINHFGEYLISKTRESMRALYNYKKEHGYYNE